MNEPFPCSAPRPLRSTVETAQRTGIAFRARHLLRTEQLSPLENTTVIDPEDRYVDLNRRTVKQSDVLARKRLGAN